MRRKMSSQKISMKERRKEQTMHDEDTIWREREKKRKDARCWWLNKQVVMRVVDSGFI
jgi:hypothetical protein